VPRASIDPTEGTDVTPEGENEERSKPQPGEPEERGRPAPSSLAPDLGWGDDNRSAQPPGERISWEEPRITEATTSAPTPAFPTSTPSTPSTTSASTPPSPPASTPSTSSASSGSSSTPVVRAPRADSGPTPPKRPYTLRGGPSRVPDAPRAPEPPRAAEPPRLPDPPAPRSAPVTASGEPPVSEPTAVAPPEPTPADAPEPAHRAAEPTPWPRPSTLRPDPLGRARQVPASIADEVDALKAQLRALVGQPDADEEPDTGDDADGASDVEAPAPEQPAAEEPKGDPVPDRAAARPEVDRPLRPVRPPVDRTGPALAELAQQLVATQSQVAAIGAQLTTLSHRLSYDLERSAQSMSERVLRDLSTLSEELRRSVSADLGPAIDDLTDQVETDRTALVAALDSTRDALAARLASIGEVVDAQPLRNVEILSALQGLSSDLEDRLERLAGRIGDQVLAFERSTSAELTRLRAEVDELRATVARPTSSSEAIDRMAGQIERLVQRTPNAEELVESLELLVSEHLEVLRDNLDTRVGALAPTLREELEAVRSESLAGVSATEEQLAERIEVLEATLAERMDLALADQIESIEAIVADRHGELLGAIQAGGEGAPVAAAPVDDHRIDEAAESAAAAVHRLEELGAALAELRELVAERSAIELAPGSVDADAMARVADELKALRRRISLRFEAEPAGGLTPDQVANLAAQISEHLH
jgi:hypothetical protein